MGTCQTQPARKRNGRSKQKRIKNKNNGSQIEKTQTQKNYFYCHNSHPLKLICHQPNCQSPALLCQSKECSQGINGHLKCSKIPFSDVTQLIKQRTNLHDKMIKKMHGIQSVLIDEIVAKRKQHFDQILQKYKDKRFAAIINLVYHNRHDKLNLKGRDAWEFVEKVKNSNNSIQFFQNDCLRNYEKELQALIQGIITAQKNMLTQYTQKCRINLNIDSIRESQLSSMPSSARQNQVFQFQSNLIKDKAQISFVQDALGDPKGLKLLFRASENKFKAATFHQKCDNVPHTFTIIQTQFNKRIAGYTPLKWNSSKGFATDPTGTSFILAMESRELMQLTRPQKAIQCIPNYGPVFGGGADIAVCNDCNVVGQSCTNFAYSYNTEENSFEYGQEAWKYLCGVEKGNNFKVLEYEVFQVLW